MIQNSRLETGIRQCCGHFSHDKEIRETTLLNFLWWGMKPRYDTCMLKQKQLQNHKIKILLQHGINQIYRSNISSDNTQ